MTTQDPRASGIRPDFSPIKSGSESAADIRREQDRGNGTLGTEFGFGRWAEQPAIDERKARADLAAITEANQKAAFIEARRQNVEDTMRAAGIEYEVGTDDAGYVTLTNDNEVSIRVVTNADGNDTTAFIVVCTLQPSQERTEKVTSASGESLADSANRAMWDAAVYKAYTDGDWKIEPPRDSGVRAKALRTFFRPDGTPTTCVTIAEFARETGSDAYLYFDHFTGDETYGYGGGVAKPFQQTLVREVVAGDHDLPTVLTENAKAAALLQQPYRRERR